MARSSLESGNHRVAAMPPFSRERRSGTTTAVGVPRYHTPMLVLCITLCTVVGWRRSDVTHSHALQASAR